jgi:hypothetical protein
MRMSLSVAAALVVAAMVPAFAGGGVNTDRGDTHPMAFGSVGQVSALEAASQTADARAPEALPEPL